jgi:hypothetical protein
LFERRHRIIPKRRRRDPWPISPNITPNKKGKVTIANTAGFAS